MRDKVTRRCPQTTTFEEKGEEPKRIRTEVPPLTSLTARPNRLTEKHSGAKIGTEREREQNKNKNKNKLFIAQVI